MPRHWRLLLDKAGMKIEFAKLAYVRGLSRTDTAIALMDDKSSAVRSGIRKAKYGGKRIKQAGAGS